MFLGASRRRDTCLALELRHVNLLRLVAYLLPFGTLACVDTAEIPQTPDLRALLASYENPTAVLDKSTVNTALASTPNLKELATGMEATQYVMKPDIDDASNTSSSRSSPRIRLQGSVRLDIRCPGEIEAPVYDEKTNGSVSLTLAIADSSLRRTFGGAAKACVIKRQAAGRMVRIELDGDMDFDLGSDIALGHGWSGELLMSLPGELRVDDYVFQSISGRITEGRFQNLVRLPEDGTTAVLELGEDGIFVRDSVGIWFCAEGQPCAQQ